MREVSGEWFDVAAGYLDTAAIGLPFARAADTLVEAITQVVVVVVVVVETLSDRFSRVL